jgi:hypothetical protein
MIPLGMVLKGLGRHMKKTNSDASNYRDAERMWCNGEAGKS